MPLGLVSMPDLRTEPRQRRSQQSIDAILDAAEQLIHEQGQVSFTAAQLAAGANMSIGRVYYWFPDIPTVVGALVDRSANRMVEVYGATLQNAGKASTAELVHRVVVALCDHIDSNPATVVLCLSGGDHRHGGALYESMVRLSTAVASDRVPGIPVAEAELVARTTIGIVLGMLNDYTRMGDQRAVVRMELIYVLTAWLYARYPDGDNQIWDHPEWPLQPSRKPCSGSADVAPVWPALAPSHPVD